MVFRVQSPQMRSDPPIYRWRMPSSIRKRKIDFLGASESGSEWGDKYNSCIGGIQRHVQFCLYINKSTVLCTIL